MLLFELFSDARTIVVDVPVAWPAWELCQSVRLSVTRLRRFAVRTRLKRIEIQLRVETLGDIKT